MSTTRAALSSRDLAVIMVAPGPRRAVQTPALANHKEEMERQDALEDEKRREYEEEGEIFRKRDRLAEEEKTLESHKCKRVLVR